jgi:hypothetical protein
VIKVYFLGTLWGVLSILAVTQRHGKRRGKEKWQKGNNASLKSCDVLAKLISSYSMDFQAENCDIFGGLWKLDARQQVTET